MADDIDVDERLELATWENVSLSKVIDGIEVRSPFRGSIPITRCRRVSYAACDAVVSLHDPHCGNPSHQPIVPFRLFLGRPDCLPRPPRRPHLTVDEDYDDVFYAVDYNPDTFRSGAVRVGLSVQQTMSAFWGISAADAVTEIQFMLNLAMSKGDYMVGDDDSHRFRWERFYAGVSPDLQVVTSFTTASLWTTPTMEAAGTMHPLLARLRPPLPGEMFGPPAPHEVFVAHFDPGGVWFTAKVVALYRRARGLAKRDRAASRLLRAEIADAVAAGRWEQSERTPTVSSLEIRNGTVVLMDRLNSTAFALTSSA